MDIGGTDTEEKREELYDGGKNIDALTVSDKIEEHHQVHGKRIGVEEVSDNAERGGGGEGETDDDCIEQEVAIERQIVEAAYGDGPERTGHQKTAEIEAQKVFGTLTGVAFQMTKVTGEESKTEIEVEQVQNIPEDQSRDRDKGVEKKIEKKDDEKLAGKVDPGAFFRFLVNMPENLQFVDGSFVIILYGAQGSLNFFFPGFLYYR
jgi:hypothetical protein